MGIPVSVKTLITVLATVDTTDEWWRAAGRVGHNEAVCQALPIVADSSSGGKLTASSYQKLITQSIANDGVDSGRSADGELVKVQSQLQTERQSGFG